MRNLRFETLELRALLTGVPVATSLSASLFGGDLWIADQPSSNQQNLLELSATEVNGVAYLRIHDPAVTFATVPLSDPASFMADNQHTLLIPQALVTGALHIHGGGSEDTLTINLDTGDVIPAGGIFFHGELPTTGAGDLLVIQGGEQGVVTYNYLNASDGDIELSNFGKITYTGLEPITNTGSATDVIFNLPAITSNSLLVDDSIPYNGMSRLIGDGAFETTYFMNPTGSVTINPGTPDDTFRIRALPDFDASLQLGSTTNRFQSLTFEGQVTLGSGHDLDAFATGTIFFPNLNSDFYTTGDGNISLTTARNILLNFGATINTVDGDLLLSANWQEPATSGAFQGIELADGVVRSRGSGNIVVQARGGTSAGATGLAGVSATGIGRITSEVGGNVSVMGVGGGGSDATLSQGIRLVNGASISSGTGSVSVEGTGGAGTGTGGGNFGVYLNGATTKISTTNGPVSVLGRGGNSGGSNHGVLVSNSAQIIAGGLTSATTVTGYGGGPGNSNVGVFVATSNITSGGGNVVIRGTGGNGAQDNAGVLVSSEGQISAAGAGALDVIGYGGSASTEGNEGVSIVYASSLSANQGPVTVYGKGGNGSSGIMIGAGSIAAGTAGALSITGEAGTGTHTRGVELHDPNARIEVKNGNASIVATAGSSTPFAMLSGSAIGSSGTGSLTIAADGVSLALSSTISQQNGVTFKPTTAGRQIDLGGVDSPTALSLTDAELDRVFAKTITIGDLSPTPVVVSAAISRVSSTDLVLRSGTTVTLTGGPITTYGNLLFDAATVRPVAVPIDIGALKTSFTAGSKLQINIGGAMPEAQYSALTVYGEIDLTGASLELTGDYVPQSFDRFSIVNNIGPLPTDGPFVGLPDNAAVAFNGVPLAIVYGQGPQQKDVLLRPAASPLITSNGGQDAAAITVIIGDLTVTTVTAIDAQPTTLHYSVTGTDGASFVIDPLGGGLQFVSSPSIYAPTDANSDNIYEVIVRAADDDGNLDTQALTITVTNLLTTANRRDLIFDSLRQQLLVTTSDGKILRYDEATHEFLLPLEVGGSLNGGDITANGSFVYVTHNDIESGTRISKVNLQTGEVTDLPYSGGFAGWDLSIASNGVALFTAAGSTPTAVAPLRQIDLATDVISNSSHANVQVGTWLDRGVDASRILVRETQYGSGHFFSYSPTTAFSPNRDLVSSQTSNLAAVSPDGSLIAMRAKGGLGIYNSSFQQITELPLYFASVAFHPTRSLLLAVAINSDQVVAFDTTTWTEQYRLNIGEMIYTPFALNIGESEISSDGNTFYVSTTAGIRVIPLPSPSGNAATLGLSNVSTYLASGTSSSLTVNLKDSFGNAAVNYRGTVHFSSSDPLAVLPNDYTFTAADGGAHTFQFSLGTAGSQTITVSDLNQNSLIGDTANVTVHAGSTQLLPITDARDLVFDSLRNVLYVTTDRGVVQRYDLATDSLLPDWSVGRKLQGADITADGSALYVQDRKPNAELGLVRKVDLATGSVRSLTYELEAGNPGYGAMDIAIAADGTALFTVEGNSWESLWKINTATDVVSKLPGNLYAFSQVIRGTNRSRILVREYGTTAGRFYTYASGGTFSADQKTNILTGNEVSAMSPDGSLMAMELDGDIVVFDSTFTAIQQIKNMQGGLIFHPTQPLLLVVDETSDEVVALNTTSWEEKHRIPIGADVGESYWFGAGVTQVSADGRKLFLITDSGIRILALPVSDGVASNVALSNYSTYCAVGTTTTVTATIRDAAGNVIPNYNGTVHFTSSDPAAVLPPDYTFTPADGGKHSFTFSLNTAGNHTVNISDISVPSITSSTPAIQVHSTPTTALPLSGARDFVFDSARNLMYILMGSGEVQRYSFATDSLLAPFHVGQSLGGGDITVSNSYLYVTETLSNAVEGMVRKVDLATGSVTNLTFDHYLSELGSWDLNIAANGMAFFTTTDVGAPIRQINTANDQVTMTTQSAGSATNILRNPSRSPLVFTETSSNGAVFTYTAATSTLSTDTNLGRYLNKSFSALNDAGTVLALAHPDRVEIRSLPGLAVTKTINTMYGGLAFKPGTNLLFVAELPLGQVSILDGNSNWARVGTLHVADSAALALLGPGTLAFNGDGSKLMLITPSSVQFVPLSGYTPAPTVSNTPANQSIAEDSSTSALTFTVADNATPAGDLVISATSSNQARIADSGFVFGGSGANRTITITPVLEAVGGSTITVTVTDSDLNSTQFTFDVMVNSVNDPPTFVPGPNHAVPYGAAAQTVNGWATNIYEGAPNEVSQTVSFQISGNSNSALFLVQPAVSATGVLTYTPAVGTFGTSTITVTPRDSGGALGTPHNLVITVGSPTQFAVSSFAMTTTGFVVEFNQPIDHTSLHLYAMPADIVLQGVHSSQPIRGSVVVDAGLQKVTFVATDGLLPPDTYNIRLRGASDGFRDTSLTPLDGDRNGSPGGDYVQSFVVSAAAPVVISLPNIVRGPGQGINVPVSATTGIPISFSNGGGLTRASFTIRYNVDLLRVTGLTVAPGMPFGATVSITYPPLTLGVANIEFLSPEPLPEGTTHFVDMQAYVPETAIYRQKSVIDITDIDLGSVATGVDDDAMQIVAFFGDVTGNGTYSAQDASIVAQFAVGIVFGLEGFRLLDPLLIGDISGNGTFSALDTSLMLQASVGILVNEIPSPLPVHTILLGGPDPKLSIPRNLAATAGQSLIIPVDIDSIVNLTGNGLESADLVIYYDPTVFEITSATLGRLVAQRGWIISSRIDPLAGRIDLSLAGTRPLEGQFRGELVQLQAKVKSNAPAGASAINLAATSRSRSTQLNEGFLTLIPAPTDAANDAIDGRVTVLANETAPSIENSARLIGEQLLITGSRGDDRILVGLTIDGRLRVRIGNQLLGDFKAPAGIAVDALTGNDFVYVAPFAPPALISANLSVHDQIFGEQNSRVIDDTNDFADSNLVAQSGVLHSEALLQLLTAWQAESEADELSPRPRSVRRLV